MPLALVFTSAPRGLTSPRSGYVTVARHQAMPERLVELLEQLGTPHERPEGATVTCRGLEAGGKRWVVLSRFAAGGLDHTRRDNRIAHHLAFAAEELAALPPPAEIARRHLGWLDRWEGEPAWLPEEPLRLARGEPLLPCTRWRELTGSGAKAAWLAADGAASPRALSGGLTTDDWLRLLAEASALLGDGAAHATFTTDATVTGGAGFSWRCQAVGGDLDLSRPETIPLPEGPLARLAATGVGSAVPLPIRPEASDVGTARAASGATRRALIALAGLAAVALAIAWWLRPTAPTPPPPAPPPRAPNAADLEATRRLFAEQAALNSTISALAEGDLARAAELWLELERSAPALASRHQDPTLSRIRAGFAAFAARRLAETLDQPEVATSPRRTDAALAEGRRWVRLGAEVGAPKDAAWGRFEKVVERAAFLRTLDVQPTLVVRGTWSTAGAGPKVALHADFALGNEAGKAVRAFLTDGLVGSSGQGRLAVGAFPRLGHADPVARLEPATIEVGQTSVWIALRPTAAGGQPAAEINVGARVNAVTLRLPAEESARLEGPLAIRMQGPRGRLALVLLPPGAVLEPLRLPAGALRVEASTRAISAAGWIEPLVASARVAGLRTGLYPASHDFPDPTIPSAVSPPNQLETTLLRLAAGHGAVRRDEVLARQEAARAGDPLRAGSPWALHAINLKGEPELTLVEFDER